MKRLQCSLYLGQEMTANSLPFTCLKNGKYQHVPGTEIPNAILWGWNQLSNINCPHAPTAIADRFHWLLLHTNTGNGTSLKNKVHGGLAYSKRTGLLTELHVLHRVIVIKCVSNGNISHPSGDQRLLLLPGPSLWEDTDSLGEGGRRRRDTQDCTSLSATDLSW